MPLEIAFTKLARNDLVKIKEYIYNDNQSAAKVVVKFIIESIEILKDNPSIGRAGRVMGTRELVISKYPYIVPYQVRDNTLYVLRVLHSTKKWN